jgi:hypothetical protein
MQLQIKILLLFERFSFKSFAVSQSAVAVKTGT